MKDLTESRDPFKWLCAGCAVGVVLLIFWIALQIGHTAWPAMKIFGFGFLTGSKWTPNRDVFGVFPFLMGTLMSSGIALLFSLPLGLAVSIFLSENFLPVPVRQAVRFVVELLAAIPSVVFGLWGIAVLIPLVLEIGKPIVAMVNRGGGPPGFFTKFLSGPATGNSLLTASLVLALMILPTIAAISRSALVNMPKTLREGAYALGSTRWEAIFGVILPGALPGIVAAVILALGRAMGETMAVAMLIGNSPRLNWSLFQPAGTLSSLLANQFGEADGLRVNALMYAALALMLLTLLVNLAGEAVLRIAQRRTAGIR